MMNPPLVNTTATCPVSARDGVLKPARPASKATRATLMPNFFMTFSYEERRCDDDYLLGKEHGEIPKHGEQNAGDGIADRKPDPGHATLDFHCGFATRTGVRPRAGNAAHQHGRVDLEDVK